MPEPDITVELFYAKWCPHCKGLIIEWNKLIKKANIEEIIEKMECVDENGKPTMFENKTYIFTLDNGKKVKLISYEDTMEKEKKEMCKNYKSKMENEEYNIGGFPTFIVTRKGGKPTEEKLPRTEQELYEYINTNVMTAGKPDGKPNKFNQCGGGFKFTKKMDRETYYKLKYYKYKAKYLKLSEFNQ